MKLGSAGAPPVVVRALADDTFPKTLLSREAPRPKPTARARLVAPEAGALPVGIDLR